MSDEVVVQAPKATVYVERSIQVRQFESLKVGIHFPVELPLTPDVQGTEEMTEYVLEVQRAIKGAFFTAKAHVYEQAGVHFEDKDGVLTEMVTAKFEGAAEVVPTQRTNAAAAPPQGAAAADAPACPDCAGEMWDNRVGKKNPKAPDFKCKSQSCGKAIWPEKKGR